jgi:hypothetical protein
MDLYSWSLIVATGFVIGRALGRFYEISNDLYLIYTHTRQTSKTRWAVVVCVPFSAFVLKCDSRAHASTVFSRFRGPRAVFDTNKHDKCGHVRSVLFGGRLSMSTVSRMHTSMWNV